jgi:rhodanese-related sulfurtransferase
MTTPHLIDPQTLKHRLDGDDPPPVLDVREEGEYNGAHIMGSICVPRRLLEIRAPQLFPYKGAQLVVCDDDGGRAGRAWATLREMGYTRVALLLGGVNRWFSDDYPVEWGINVPSKDFGERVEVCDHVPTWSAIELSRRIANGEKLRIFDTRTPQEFSRFSIPGAECIPNVEIARWAHDLRRNDPDTTIVINCGGRTRSIIGARTLLRMGLDNVVSLKNGTSGWALAGLKVELGNTRVREGVPSEDALRAADKYGRAVAAEDGVKLIDLRELDRLFELAKRQTVHFIDVRTRAEYVEGHISGFTWFPGGQTIQRSDDVVPFRTAPIVFCCDSLARAAVTASWFRQIGFPNVMAVDGGISAWRSAGRTIESGDPFEKPAGFASLAQRTEYVSPRDLAAAQATGKPPRVVFVGTSREFADGHVPGAQWISRSKADLVLEKICPDRQSEIVVADVDPIRPVMAASDLARSGFNNVAVLDGGMGAWADAGLPVERGLAGVMSAPEDVLPTIPNRSFENMMNYLSWEENLGRKYACGSHRGEG